MTKPFLREAKEWAINLIRQGMEVNLFTYTYFLALSIQCEQEWRPLEDSSVYVGGAGIAYMFLRLAERSPDQAQAYLDDAR